MTRWLAAVLALALAATAACDSGAKQSVTQVAAPDDVLDEALMVALLQAKNFHHKADVYLDDGNVEQALVELRRILTVPFPPGAPEGEDVRLDARARIGKLLLGQSDLDGALQVVDEGIASASRESYFLANVHAVRGDVLHAKAKSTDDAEAGRQLRHQAQDAYDASIRINEAIQKRLMKEMGL